MHDYYVLFGLHVSAILLAEGQAGVRSGQRTVEEIFNSRVVKDKYLQHQHDLFHNFIDFKNSFDGVWRAGLREVLRSFNIEEGLVQTI